MLKRFKLPIYGAHIWFVLDSDLNKARKKLDRYFGKDSENCNNFDGMVVYEGNKFALLLTLKPSVNTISHEIEHLTQEIAAQYDFDYSAEYGEPKAYLNGYLTEMFYDFLNKNKKGLDIAI